MSNYPLVPSLPNDVLTDEMIERGLDLYWEHNPEDVGGRYIVKQIFLEMFCMINVTKSP
jgi:hypothetical protein